MKKNLIIILGVVVIVVALLAWGRMSQPVDEIYKLAGKPAPDFSLADGNEKIYNLQSLKGKNILLFFSEGLICYPACWDEMIALGKDTRFQENDTVVLSVVVDSKEDWQKATKEFPDLKQANIIFDANAQISRKYGMLNAKSSMHQGSLPGHTYILVDKTGIIKFIFDDIKMGKNGNMLIEQVKKLNI